MTERDPVWIAAAPLQTQATRTVAASPEAVWAVVADHTGWPAWFPALKDVTVTGAPEGVGGQRRVTVAGMRFDEVFTAWEPGRLFAFTVVATRPRLLASMAESVALTPEGDSSTIVVYSQGFAARRGFGWFWKLNRKRMQASLDQAMDTLADRLG